jgi:hypothetical protein
MSILEDEKTKWLELLRQRPPIDNPYPGCRLVAPLLPQETEAERIWAITMEMGQSR